MRFFAITALLGLSVSALPTVDNSVVARSASPEAIAEAIAESSDGIAKRAQDIQYANVPSSKVTCPKTKHDSEHTYTANQIKVAYMGGASLSAQGRQIGLNKYPHKYIVNQALPNGCGSGTLEFPILTSNKLFTGDKVMQMPDRVLYEVKEKGKKIMVKYCGVIRHGENHDWLNCA